MDGRDVEPRDRLHEDHTRLRPLLRRAVFGAVPWCSGPSFPAGFDLTLRPERLDQPLKWTRPRMIFVNSTSDLFHKQVPLAFIDQVLDVMEAAKWHIFQVLTKRSSLMRDHLRQRYGRERGPAHIWCGVSVEDAQAKARIDHLRSTPAGMRFLSIEPLIGAVGRVDLAGIDWVIAGGESGPGARPIHLEWVREIRDQCVKQTVPFFFEQWGGLRKRRHSKRRPILAVECCCLDAELAAAIATLVQVIDVDMFK